MSDESDYIDESDVTPGPDGSRRREPSNARKIVAVVVASVLVMAVVIGGGLAWAFWSFSRPSGVSPFVDTPLPASPAGTITPGGSTESTAVPDVVSLQLDAASERLHKAGLELGAVTRVYVDGYTIGSVIAQSPAADTDAVRGTAVSLTVSKGSLSAELPSVVGLTVAKAKSVLGTAGLVVSTVHYVYDERVASGLVVSLAADGTRQPQRGDSVSLTVSKGRAPVRMVSLIGMSPAQATSACRALGVGLTLTPSGATQGVVFRQSPSAGSDIVPGSSAGATVDMPPRASVSARITRIDDTWEKYNNQLGAHITCTSTSSDDRKVASLRWQVQGLDVSASGTGNEISFILPGWRRYGSTTVTLTVVDASGQSSGARKIIKVNWDTGTLQ